MDDGETDAVCVVASLHRYPVKSLPGEGLARASLSVARGVSGDRAWALANGHAPIAPDGDWTPCAAFERLTIRPAMAAWSAQIPHHGSPELSGPNGERLRFAPDGRPADRPPAPFADDIRLVRASGGCWDHADGVISIINLNTVAEIARAAGREIDPQRFRGNLHIRAEPWAEFGWLGRRLAFDNVSIDVIRPIDRCRATSVRPGDGAIDINMPAHLLRSFGHMYCGVYASVPEDGVLETGDRGRIGSPISDSALRRSAKQATAPTLTDWPRSARVLSITEEAEGVRSLWLHDPLGRLGALSDYRAAQHLRVHGLTARSDWRTYTISAISDDALRITVKRDRGPGSHAVHALNVGDRVTITGPFGGFVTPDGDAPLFFWTAGIGITPAIAMLRAMEAADDARLIEMTHVVRTRKEAALWPEAERLIALRSGARACLWTSHDDTGDAHGRPDLVAMAARAAEIEAQIALCGPPGFMAAARDALLEAAIPADRIFAEVFTSPDVDVTFREPSETGPLAVRFEASGIDAVWSKTDGTLLDLAERHGVAAPSHCRAGLCGSCRAPLLSGQVETLTGAELSERSALICCSTPLGPIALDL